jgi:tRNA modification GTPase
VEKIRQQLMLATGQLEAMIEFPEEVSQEEEGYRVFSAAAQAAQDEIQSLLQIFQESHLYRDGVMVSVVGRPNVGKSSILNALLEKERAIVTALAGTTRDLVSDSFQVSGIPIQITDTAGMRTSEDVIEKIGVSKTKESIATAQLILFVVDAKEGYCQEDESIYQKLKDKSTLLVINKIDLVSGAAPPVWMNKSTPHVTISAKYRQNIETLKEQMVGLITQGSIGTPTSDVVPNLRQKKALEKASINIASASSAALVGESEEFIVFHLQSALNGLGTITGDTHTDDLLDVIFDRFCIGK